MFIPYSTDAPIYYFPWMTIGLIVVNSLTFVLTGMGLHSHGWLLTYGNGLHPVEWIAYNFLHFGPAHLIGNMFFLWAFGIVVEGKLGWWKFLSVYMGIGILGGVLIQIAMLGYSGADYALQLPHHSPPNWWSDQTVYAQEFGGNQFDQAEVDDDADMADDELPAPARDADPNLPAKKRKNGDVAGQGKGEKDVELEEEADEYRPGAGGASLVIYGLMAMVLVWAPRNELHGIWIGFRSGTIEIEYLYFCGFYIITEVLSAVFSSRGFEISSEVGHATGAVLGFGAATLFVKQHWVDCENWDLFAVMKGTHGATESVGEWQNNFALGLSERQLSPVVVNEDAERISAARKKKRKAMPKLVELESLEDSLSIEIPPPKKSRQPAMEPWEEDTKTYINPVGGASDPDTQSLPPIPNRKSRSDASNRPRSSSESRASRSRSEAKSSRNTVYSRLRRLLMERHFDEAFIEYLDQKSQSDDFQLDQEELRLLANGLFKDQAAPEAASLLEEYLERFPNDADRPRVKLAVLNVRFLQRPTYALKLLAKVEPGKLAEDYREIYYKTARYAQQMIADGMVDVEK